MRVTIVGQHKGPSEMLQRRVGGILKDIAQVDVCGFDEMEKANADIYVCYSQGIRYPLIREKFKGTNKKVVAAELTLLPVGIRILNTLEKGRMIGVAAEHLRCANYFLGEILKAGVLDYHFVACTIYELKDMNLDVYAIPEELIDMVDKNHIRGKKILSIPRTITPMCAAELINAVLNQ